MKRHRRRRLSIPVRCFIEALESRELLSSLMAVPSASVVNDAHRRQHAATSAAAPSVPAYHSNPSAPASLFLDFDGHFEANWGGYRNVTTPAFDTDGDSSSFSAGELAAIQEIWQRVAEDFAPFNIDVTTAQPANLAHGKTMTVAIGGDSGFLGGNYGGYAWIGSFVDSSTPNVAYVFPANLANVPKYMADATSHEAGHGFGLDHQRLFNANGSLANEYSDGDGTWGPIMGVAYYDAISTWWNGPSGSATSFQDDMRIISSSTNGFGYRPDDFGNSAATAFVIDTQRGSFSRGGVIAQNSDVDVFSLDVGTGMASLSVAPATVGPNLDPVVELRDANGVLVASASADLEPRNLDLGPLSLAAGTYYVFVRSDGLYGRVGQYTLSGQVTPGTTPTNRPPAVSAGPDQTILTGQSVTFDGTVTDDGLPNGTLTSTWSMVSGPTSVTFANLSSVDTTATFSTSGTYVLRLTVSDGQYTVSDDVTVTVNALPQKPDGHGHGRSSPRKGALSEHELSGETNKPFLWRWLWLESRGT